jgi:hypothetical protein
MRLRVTAVWLTNVRLSKSISTLPGTNPLPVAARIPAYPRLDFRPLNLLHGPSQSNVFPLRSARTSGSPRYVKPAAKTLDV